MAQQRKVPYAAPFSQRPALLPHACAAGEIPLDKPEPECYDSQTMSEAYGEVCEQFPISWMLGV